MKKPSFTRDALLFAGLAAAGFLVVVGGAFALVALAQSGLGCNVHEGNPNKCLLLGVDIGELLYALGMIGMLGAMTSPFVLLIILGALLVAAGSWLWSRLGRD